MKKLKVLYSFPLRIGRTGIGMTAYYQVKGLIDNEVDVVLFTLSLEKEIKGLKKIIETFKLFKIKIPVKLFGKNNVMLFHDRKVARYLKKNYKAIDIVHCWPSGALNTLKVANKYGIKSFIERQSANTSYVIDKMKSECSKLGVTLDRTHYGSMSIKKIRYQDLEFRKADKLLCPSKFVAGTFINAGYPEESIAYEQYGYDEKEYKTVEFYQSSNDVFTIMYLGQANPLKGLHFALEAWISSNLSETGIFYICGDIIKNYNKVIEKYLEHKSVIYTGFISGQEKFDYLSRAHVLVLPSLAEGSALVTYEARACGCVLCVSDASGALAEHGLNSMVHKAGNVDELKSHMEKLAYDKDFYNILRNNSISEISSLTWGYAAKQLIKTYQN